MKDLFIDLNRRVTGEAGAKCFDPLLHSPNYCNGAKTPFDPLPGCKGPKHLGRLQLFSVH